MTVSHGIAHDAHDFSMKLIFSGNFEGSEIKGQTGCLLIKRDQCTFIQKSDVNGEWLTLRGVCEEIA